MGRTNLPVGTYGAIRVYPTATGFRVRTLYRDFDGQTRPVERKGKTKSATARALIEALRDRARTDARRPPAGADPAGAGQRQAAGAYSRSGRSPPDDGEGPARQRDRENNPHRYLRHLRARYQTRRLADESMSRDSAA